MTQAQFVHEGQDQEQENTDTPDHDAVSCAPIVDNKREIFPLFLFAALSVT